MNYEEAMSYLDGLGFFGIRLGLGRIRYLLEKLGNPEKELKVIHVAGTNGKGSVCAIVSSILQAAGYKVGMYTSPHLVDFRERISVNHSWISKNEVADVLQRIIPIAEEIAETKLGHPTYFEIVTAAALHYLSMKKCDLAVLEVGMGGRLDATNVVDPIVSVITNVTLEHSEHLGDTVSKIAKEKSGIIKKGRPVITSAKGPALKVIENTAGRLGSELIKAGKKIKPVSSNLKDKGQRIRYKDLEIFLPLLGGFQLENANTTLEVVELLQKRGFGIPDSAVREGLERVKWPGRFQIVNGEPMIIIDCAHNPAGMHSLRKTLDKMFGKTGKGEITLVTGISSDKDIPAMVSEIAPLASNTVVTKHSFVSRAASPEAIAGMARKYSKNVFVKPDVHEALDFAKSLSGKSDKEGVILVTGSIYTVGDALCSI